MSPTVHPQAQEAINNFHADIISEVSKHVSSDRIVVVGMKQNPVVKKGRKILEEQGLKYTYLEYGSYFSQWKQRLAIKMCSQWPTFPQIFINGLLIGGASDLQGLIDRNELQDLLKGAQDE